MIFNQVAPPKKGIATWDELEGSPAEAPHRFFRLEMKAAELFPRMIVGVFRTKMADFIVVVMIVGVLAALALPVGDHDYTHQFPPPGPNPGNGFAAVAGEYYQGASRGRYWRLSLLPDGRYSFIWSGCTGVHCRESGSAWRVNGRIVLTPVKAIEPRMERVFVPIKWGYRTYLIPPTQLKEFSDAIIRGEEPRDDRAGRYYVLGLDFLSSGVPELPGQWAAYLRENLLIGTIVEVKKEGRAKVDMGTSQGLSVGRLLAIQGHRFHLHEVRVVSVDADSCEIEERYPHRTGTPFKVGCHVVGTRGINPEPGT